MCNIKTDSHSDPTESVIDREWNVVWFRESLNLVESLEEDSRNPQIWPGKEIPKVVFPA